MKILKNKKSGIPKPTPKLLHSFEQNMPQSGYGD
jgi:hypothetical protein